MAYPFEGNLRGEGSMRTMLAPGRAKDGGRSGSWPMRAVAAVVAGLVLTACAAAQDLNREVSAALGRARLGTCTVGVSVMDVQSGKSLAALNEDRPFIPASNLKLLSSGAAVLVLGPDYEFKTRLLRRGTQIIVQGSGDPGFADPKLLDDMHTDVGTLLDRLVQAIVASGMKQVSEVILNDRVFDREYVHPEWPSDQLNLRYCAEVSGLNFHANVLRIYAAPGPKEGSDPVIRSEPSARWLEVEKRARTVTSGSTVLSLLRQGSSTRFIVNGTVGAPVVEEVTVHEGSVILGRLLADRLAAAGIGRGSTAGAGGSDPPPARLAAPEEDLGSTNEVLAVVKTPMSIVLTRCNTDSYNLYAEALIKAVGKAVTGQPGSWANGAAALRMQVRDRLGPEAAASLVMVDGSGLSRANRVTPLLLTGWLRVLARDEKAAEPFVTSLALPGDGTLQNRFRGKGIQNEIRGKSGFVKGVRTLSGYVTQAATGRRVAFSILVNDIPTDVPAARVKTFHEDVVEAIDQWLSQHAAVPAGREDVGG